jgi:hypothetical protein
MFSNFLLRFTCPYELLLSKFFYLIKFVFELCGLKCVICPCFKIYYEMVFSYLTRDSVEPPSSRIMPSGNSLKLYYPIFLMLYLVERGPFAGSADFSLFTVLISLLL